MWTIDEDSQSLSFVLRLQLRRPDGGTYNIETRIARDHRGAKDFYDILHLHADNMRKRAEVDIRKQRWNKPEKEDTLGSFGEAMQRSVDNSIMDALQRPDYADKTQTTRIDGFWQGNYYINVESYNKGQITKEPLDELRINVAKWLHSTKKTNEHIAGAVRVQDIQIQRHRMRGV